MTLTNPLGFGAACALVMAVSFSIVLADPPAPIRGVFDITVTHRGGDGTVRLISDVNVDLVCLGDATRPRSTSTPREFSGKTDAAGHVTIEAPRGGCVLNAYGPADDRGMRLGWESIKIGSPPATVRLGSDTALLGPHYIDDFLPVRLSAVEPIYPPIARRIHLEGHVILRASIDKDGNVTDARVLLSTNPMFDDSAIQAVKQWKYKPSLHNGEPVEIGYTLRVDYWL